MLATPEHFNNNSEDCRSVGAKIKVVVAGLVVA